MPQLLKLMFSFQKFSTGIYNASNLCLEWPRNSELTF